MDKETSTCPNCEEDYNKGANFCPHCGQKTDETVTIGNLFYNTITNYFSFDARFFKSFIPLIMKPGFLPKKFIEGKRLLYLHPAQMYLFVSVIFFFLFSFVQRESIRTINENINKENIKEAKLIDSVPQKAMNQINFDSVSKVIKNNKKQLGLSEEETQELDSIIKLNAKNLKSNSKDGSWNTNFGYNQKEIDSLMELGVADEEIYQAMGMEKDAGYFTRKFYKQILKLQKNMEFGSIAQTFYDAIPISMFFLLPIFALLVFLFYFNKGRFSHHLVFSFYFFSFLFTAFSIILAVNFIWDIPNWIDFLIMLSTFFYLYFALKRYYEQGYILTFFKAGFLTFMFLIFVLPLAAGFVLAYAFFFY